MHIVAIPAVAPPSVPDDLGQLVRAALGRPGAEVLDHAFETVDYDVGSPTTAGLYRLTGTAIDGTEIVPWSLFIKIVQSWRHWPLLELMPAELQERGLREWRYEAELYQGGLVDLMPAGMRLPVLHRVQELEDDRIALWMEDVRVSPVPWDTARFERAAYLLGRLAARRTGAPSVGEGPGNTVALTALYYENRVLVSGMPELADDALWSHPLMTAPAHAQLRAGLRRLAGVMPFLLEEFAALPQLRVHGDACPQNLLVPADAPESFVVIDWAMDASDACGAELAQLLVGLAHAGELDPIALPALHAVVVPAYVAGLRAEGVAVTADQVRFGSVVALMVRAAFTSLPYDRLSEPSSAEMDALFARRLALTRLLVDLGLELATTVAA